MKLNANLSKRQLWAAGLAITLGISGYFAAPYLHNEDPLGQLKLTIADPSLSSIQKIDKISEIRKKAIPLRGKSGIAGL